MLTMHNENIPYMQSTTVLRNSTCTHLCQKRAESIIKRIPSVDNCFSEVTIGFRNKPVGGLDPQHQRPARNMFLRINLQQNRNWSVSSSIVLANLVYIDRYRNVANITGGVGARLFRQCNFALTLTS